MCVCVCVGVMPQVPTHMKEETQTNSGGEARAGGGPEGGGGDRVRENDRGKERVIE